MDEDLDSIIGILNAQTKAQNPTGASGITIKKEDEKTLPKNELDIQVTTKENTLIKKESNLNPTKDINSSQKEKIIPNEDNGEDEDLKNYKFSDEENDSNLKNTKINKFKIITLKYLYFRPYIGLMNQRPSLPPDRGYYFKFLKSDVQIVRFILEDNGFRESQNVSQQWSILWSTSAMQSQIYQQLQKYQKVNHFPKSIEVTRKDCMYKNISKMMSLYGQRHYPFIPKTYILPEEHRQLAEEMDKSPDIFWIVKPAASSQGKGIFVTNNYEEIPSKTNLIVSRYIDNPFLIDGFKFDLRIYLAITCINPLRLYMYEEGLVRFATVKYSNELELNKGNRFIHLTNYSVNKYSDSFLPNIDPNKDGQGSKWSLSALKRFLEKNGVNPSHLISQIEDILIKSVLSIEPIINSNYEMYVPFRDNCFELLGFDILIDNSLSPWLLEVNLSPSMNCDSPLDQKIKGDLLSDLFTMIGIVPLDLRTYINNNPINKINNQFNAYTKELSTNKGKRGNAFSQNRSLNSNLTKQDLEVIKESEEEFKR